MYSVEEFLKDLNPSQREAVLYNDGPSLVIAGAQDRVKPVYLPIKLHICCKQATLLIIY